jgi:hypothetical protein
MSFPHLGSYVGPTHAARRVSWFLLFLVGVALTVTLYFVKTHAQSAKRDVRVLTRAIAAEDAAIRVLRAELAYLESPTRLSELNDLHLSLAPIRPDQERSADAIEQLFPLIELSSVETGQ